MQKEFPQHVPQLSYHKQRKDSEKFYSPTKNIIDFSATTNNEAKSNSSSPMFLRRSKSTFISSNSPDQIKLPSVCNDIINDVEFNQLLSTD